MPDRRKSKPGSNPKQKTGKKGEMKRGAAPMELRARHSIDANRENGESDSDMDMSMSFKKMGHKPGLGRYKGPAKIYMNAKYEPPELDKAMQHYKESHLWDHENDSRFSVQHKTFGRDCFDGKVATKCDPFKEGIESEFFDYGPGLSSYFKILKAFGWLFFIFSVLSVPSLVINSTAGDYLGILTRTTVGNIFDDTVAEDELTGSGDDSDVDIFYLFMPGLCEDTDCPVSRNILLTYYVVLDLIMVAMFLITLEYLRYFHKKDSLKFARKSPNLEYYTIEALNMPDGATYEEIKQFFEERCGEVEDLQLVDDTHDIIPKSIAYSKLKKKFDDTASILRARTEKYNDADERVKTVFRKFKKLEQQLENFWSDFVEDDSVKNATKAFITFESRESHAKCIEMFAVNRSCCTCCGLIYKLPCYSKDEEQLKLRDVRIYVADSPPPSTIVWENIEYPTSSRRLRTFFSFFAAALLLMFSWVLSTVIGLVAQSFGQEIDLDELQADDCVGENAAIATLQGTLNGTAFTSAVEAAGLQTLYCYCSGLTINEFTNTDECSVFAFSVLENFGAIAVGAILVVVVNEVILKLLKFTVTFEKHYDVVVEEGAILIRVFIATFINSAIIVIIENADTEALFGFSFSDAGLSQGDYSDFSADWYGDVGAEILLFAIVNIVGPHVLPLMSYAYAKYLRTHRKVASQLELNELWLGPGFSLAVRYAQMLVMIYLCFMYSAGIPILNVVAFCALFVTFWVDKFMLLHVCRTPPVYSNLMANESRRILYYAPVLHLMMSIAMLSAPDIFPQSADERQNALSSEIFGSIFSNSTLGAEDPNSLTIRGVIARMLRASSFPLSMTLVLIIVVLILANFKFFADYLNSLRIRFVKWITKKADESAIDEENEESFFEKVSVLKKKKSIGGLQGISSYNILANPEYKRNFVLPGNFEVSQVHTSGEIVQHLSKDIRGKAIRLVGLKGPIDLDDDDEDLDDDTGV